MKKKRIYISIPISNLDLKTQRANAHEKEEYLKGLGYDVFNPFSVPDPPEEFNKTEKERYAWYMGEDIKQLLLCDAIYMCKRWRKSGGCAIEIKIARQMGMDILYETESLD